MGSARGYDVLIGPSAHTKFPRFAAFFEQTDVHFHDPIVGGGGETDRNCNTGVLVRNMSYRTACRSYSSGQVLVKVCFFPI
jgi:hypothetical protein